jgi:uncharacterized protein (TIGR02246 family)
MKINMRKLFLLLITLLLMSQVVLAQAKSNSVETESFKKELTLTLDKMYMAYNTRDIRSFLSLMADDGLFCGTDSKNIYDRATYANQMTEMFADSSFSPNITVDKREIHFDTDRNSAMVVDQFFFPWNNKIPVRHVAHFIKIRNKWVCNFISTSFIPNDEDLGKIFDAVK